MRTIVFLDMGKPFNGETVRAAAAGGIQHATVSLAEAFARAGHRVTVYNNTPRECEVNGVHWKQLQNVKAVEADLVLTNNHAQVFGRVATGKKVVWFHNPVAIHRQYKRGDLFAVFRHRPHAVFLGQYHEATASRLLPFASRHIIELAQSGDFVRTQPAVAAPPPRAVFTSQPYRGLKWLLDVWAKQVRPAVSNAELHLFTADRADIPLQDYASFGVVQRGRIPRDTLASELMAARLLFCPGHVHETYCFAAAEATLAGLPIISRGIGSLAERVQHGKNGYIAAEADGFAQHAVTLLKDDAAWLDMHHGALATRDLSTWDDRVAQWTDAFLHEVELRRVG